jgi:DNA-binding transcriptional MerR regulator
VLQFAQKRLACDVTSPFIVCSERRKHLNQHLYTTSRFASKACVTARTLRYYDRVGLLTPSAHTESGHRLYSNSDLVRLQQILALKFLGFSLEEIKHCLKAGPTRLRDALTLQKTLLEKSRAQIDQIILALDYARQELCDECQDWETLIKLIRLFQMSSDFSKQYYTEEQRLKIAEWGKNWTPEDQKVASQRWDAAIAELQRLIAAGEDPASPSAQSLAREWYDLVQSFSHGDKGIEKSLGNMYNDISKMPEDQRPYPMPFDQKGGEFINQAIKIYISVSSNGS